jgi:hypothetical protein
MSDFELSSIEPLVFIHIPKTAGTSFRLALEEELGPEAFLRDYGLEAPETSELVKRTVYNDCKNRLYQEVVLQKIYCLSGHFHASKYTDIFNCNVRMITFLRDPLQRTISEYQHYTRHLGYQGSLEDFCNRTEQYNRQSQLISGFDLEDFFFIGLTEFYEESIVYFNQITGWELPCYQENVGRQQLADKYYLNNSLMQCVQEVNLQDIELYKTVRSKFYGSSG